MTHILQGKTISIEMQKNLRHKRQEIFDQQDIYVAILFFGDNSSSRTYVHHKQKYGQDINILVEIFGQKEIAAQAQELAHLTPYKNKTYNDINAVLELINFLNNDAACVGIIVQLPLPTSLETYKLQILCAVSPTKDIDGLGGILSGLSANGLIDFLPATPKAVMTLLQHYEIDQLDGEKIAILGQSNLAGKPLAIECIKRGATVYSCNKETPDQEIKRCTQRADMIISCTGAIHLIDDTFVRHDQTQIVIDVGYGHKDGEPVGDVQISKIADLVSAYTPVPGGIGPLTVACLFDNIFELKKYATALQQYKL